MTDRTDSVNPAENEPSNGGTADEVAWPVWGASSSRPALRPDESARPAPTTDPEPTDPEPVADAEDTAAEDSAAEDTAAETPSDESPVDVLRGQEPDEASSDSATVDAAPVDAAPVGTGPVGAVVAGTGTGPSDTVAAGTAGTDDPVGAADADDEADGDTGPDDADDDADNEADGDTGPDDAGDELAPVAEGSPSDPTTSGSSTVVPVAVEHGDDDAALDPDADDLSSDLDAADPSDADTTDVDLSDVDVDAAELDASDADSAVVDPSGVDTADSVASGADGADAVASGADGADAVASGAGGADAVTSAAVTGGVDPADVVTADVDSKGVVSADVDSADVDSKGVDSADVDSADVDAGDAVGADADAPNVSSVDLDSSDVGATAPETSDVAVSAAGLPAERPERPVTAQAEEPGSGGPETEQPEPERRETEQPEPELPVAERPGAEATEAEHAGSEQPEMPVAPPAATKATDEVAPSSEARATAGAPQRSSVLPRRDEVAPRTSAPEAAPVSAPGSGADAGSATAPVSQAVPSPVSAPVPPALAGAARVSAGPVPQTPREASPFDEFEAEPDERRWPRRLLIGVGALVVLAGGYVGACYATADRVPRGTTVAGVDLGGLSSADAVDRLGTELATTTGTAVAVQANDVQASLDPAAAGLSFDARATVDELTGVDLADPVRLWHQVAGLGEHDPVTQVDQAKLTSALEALGTSLSLAPVDGQVMFVEGAAMMTDAADGWALDQAAAADVVARDWLVAAQPLSLPTTVVEPEITQAEAQAALDDVARPLVSAPISVTVQDKLAVLQPATVAAAASMQPEDGDLVLRLDGEALAKEVVDQLPEGVLTSASDAHFEFQDDKPVLVPGEPGTTVAPDDVAAAVAAVASAQDRTADVALSETDPAETTEAMEKLGIKEIVSEFSTPLTAETQRTINIRQGLANITGVLIRPGETFSLTEALGPIDKAHGFVPAGAIVNGEHSDAWGGGLSQVSTTTFNAAYLAGMEDVEHTPHSEWFARYPEGREATIYTGVLDMKWKNTTPYGALVQGWIADGRAYVRIWGTKYWTVESTTSGRSGVVQPSTVYSDSKSCTPSSGGNPGFTVTVTRKLFLDGELQDTTAKTWRYKPQNRVVCGPPPSKDDAKDDKDAKD